MGSSKARWNRVGDGRAGRGEVRGAQKWEGLWAVIRKWRSLTVTGETVADPGISSAFSKAGGWTGRGQGGRSPSNLADLDKELLVAVKAAP